ncbi:MAG: DNA polymerase IV [Euryarchaeota archaeon]|nr:DNA polymerase IV [Euryarchaeota archaeon]|tara:strand:- start:1306 stop:2451 length:1146 start_codon:yes stop_codon:yes gene_type:complete
MNFKHYRQVCGVVGKERIIIHCDLDAFFASVEILHHGFPEDEPLIIGSDPMQGRGRGIVSTCNYAAREYGVRSAMPISEAWRRCPGHPFGPARFIRGTRSLYSMASRRVMKILRNDADTFEQASIDEAYLDVSEKVDGDWDEAMALARRLQRAIQAKVGLTASFGIGSTRIIAKMSSEVNKPNGIHRVLPDEIQAFFESRSVRDVPGIGPKTANVLAEWGITTMDEAVELGELALARMTSHRFASWILRVVEGSTSNEVSPLRSRRSIGKERTFSVDQSDHEHVLDVLEQLTIGVLKKAQLEGIAGRLAEVKIRYTGFETHTHGRSIPVAMDDTEVFLRQVRRLFAENVHQEEKIRLIGFRLGQLEALDSKQTTLVFEESE